MFTSRNIRQKPWPQQRRLNCAEAKRARGPRHSSEVTRTSQHAKRTPSSSSPKLRWAVDQPIPSRRRAAHMKKLTLWDVYYSLAMALPSAALWGRLRNYHRTVGFGATGLALLALV